MFGRWEGRIRLLAYPHSSLLRLALVALSSRSAGGRISIPIWGKRMIRTQRTQETEPERRERLQREREAMQQAIASYTGPVTKCPTGRSTSDPYGLGKHRRPARTRARNGDGRSG